MSRGEFKKFLTAQLRDPKTGKKQLVAFAKLYHEIGMCKGKPRGKSGNKLRAQHDEREVTRETESTELFELVRKIEKEAGASNPPTSGAEEKSEKGKERQSAREESEQERQVTKGREALVLAELRVVLPVKLSQLF